MRLQSAIPAFIAVTCAAAIAQADLRDPPRGPGTETGYRRVGDAYRVYEGAELGGFVGGGYGIGFGGRVGYAFSNGAYAGGAFTFYTENASFLGGELGYKFFPGYHWELRPYVFAGPAFLRVGPTGFGRPAAETVFAFQPGLLGAYRFDRAFISAELRGYVTPNPGAFAFFGGAGVSL